MSRVEFNKKQRIAIWTRADGHCEGCKAKLKTHEGEYDHRIPYALTRDTSVENGQLLCKVCHSGKTHKTDRPNISKAERIAAKHSGAWPKSRTPMRGRGFDQSRLWAPAANREELD